MISWVVFSLFLDVGKRFRCAFFRAATRCAHHRGTQPRAARQRLRPRSLSALAASAASIYLLQGQHRDIVE